MLNKFLSKLGYEYVKQVVGSDHLDYLGYSDFVLKLGKRSLLIRSICGKFIMIQYTSGVIGRSILKGV